MLYIQGMLQKGFFFVAINICSSNIVVIKIDCPWHCIAE